MKIETFITNKDNNMSNEIFGHNYLVDCTWAAWNSWSACNQPCGGGTRTKSRTKSVAEAYGGTCSGALTDTEVCNSQECPGLNLPIV